MTISSSSTARPQLTASASSSSTSPHPPFHFPGPSSKYHHAERPRLGQHGRFKSCTTGTAPVLTTEARAHRRAQTNRGSLSNAAVHSLPPSPSPLSEYSRSPLSRFSSTSTSAMGPAATSASTMPHTPAKKGLRRNSSLQHSPFSDYFTDEARSIDSASVHSNAPSMETKQLLVRMNILQSQLMRNHSDASREAISIVGRKLGEIELELNSLHSHKRSHAELDDSGVFMDDEESDTKSTTPHSRQVSMHSSYALSFDGAMHLPAQPETLEQYKAERDWFVLRMQDLVDGLTTAQSELSKRYVEVRELNERHNAEMEEREMQLEQLRSENEGLRSDLGFEYKQSFPKDTPTDLEGHNHTQGVSEPQIAEKTYVYTERGTQTKLEVEENESQDEEQEEDDLFEATAPEAENQLGAEEYLGGEDAETREEDENEDEDDCAITTSSEDTYDVEEEDDVQIEEPITSVRPKSAWQELWSSLHNLSGLGDEDEEEEDD